MDRMFSATNTWSRKLSTSGAFSARSSRHAGLFPRSQLISSKATTVSRSGSWPWCLIVEPGSDITSWGFGADFLGTRIGSRDRPGDGQEGTPMVLQPEEAGHATSVSGDEAGRGRQIRLAAVASVIGTSIEWYDFFLYGTAAAIVFPSVFFPSSSAYAGTLESFATYAVGFAARPVGAAIFGHWGDRIGRKATLIITLLMMGIASALVGVLPGTNTIGVAAPILLVVLRLLQGVAVGGEWSGSVLLSMEWGKQNKRGLMASWPQIGVPIGLLLGTGMMTLIALAAPDAFKAWAWRIPFLASLILVAIGLWVRLKVLETPLFAELVRKRTVSKLPVLDVIRRCPKQIVLSALLRMSEQAPFYLYTAFALDYIKDHLHKSTGVGLAAVTVGGALELFLIPTFGSLSDRLGRRRVYATGAILMGIAAFPFFLLLNTAALGFIILGTALMKPRRSEENTSE